ncbi:MAG TPA: hypothetical protein VHO90_15510 [Bacteroidales bacterium]|jgi:hypothetical protein|nr:hypothetical protein [Bacteroidales bacterium]
MKIQVGTLAKSGERCPETGLWEVQDCQAITFVMNKGNILPPYKGNEVYWKFIDYVPLEGE